MNLPLALLGKMLSSAGVAVMATLLAARVYAVTWPDWDKISYVDLDAAHGTGASGTMDTWNGDGVSADKHYRVPAGLKAGGRIQNPTFGGASFTLLGTLCQNNYYLTVPVARLMGGGSILLDGIKAITFTQALVDDSTATDPFVFKYSRPNAGQEDITVWGAFYGSANARIAAVGSANTPRSIIDFSRPDFSNFFGTISVSATDNVNGIYTNCIGRAKGCSFPGRYEIGDKIRLQEVDTVAITFGTLSLGAGSAFEVKNDGGTVLGTTVTTKLELAPGSKLALSAPVDVASVLAQSDKSLHLISLRGTAADAANLPDLSNLNISEIAYVNQSLPSSVFTPSLAFVDVSGGKDIVLRLQGENVNVMSTQNTAAVGSAMTNATMWSLGHLPVAGETAYVTARIYVPQQKEMRTFEADRTIITDSMVLYGAGLWLSELELVNGMVEASESNWRNYETMATNGVKGVTYLGARGIDVSGDLNRLEVAAAHHLMVDGPFSGSGNVRAATSEASSVPYGAIEFLSDNTAWSGKLELASYNNRHQYTNSVNGCRLQFYLRDGRSIGGALEEFTYDAFTVRHDSIVIGRNSIAFNEPTRGLFVPDRARFVMTNETDGVLTVNCPVTFGGEMIFGNDYPDATYAKTGPGCGMLVMGGSAAYFHDGTGLVDAPVAGKNRLVMQVGRLVCAATNALNGVAVVFAADSEGLEVRPETASDDVAVWGLVDTSVDNPFTVQRADGKIPVHVKLSAKPATTVTTAICTVNATAAQTITAATFAPKCSVKGVRAKVVSRTNGDGSVTYLAESFVSGMALIIR